MKKENESNKYLVPDSEQEGEILSNKKGITTKAEIDSSELLGFLKAQNFLIDKLDSSTVFDLNYLYRIHELALGDLYEFAGNLRTVNMSKAGFLFPAARFLPQSMLEFEKNILVGLSKPFESNEEFIKALAMSHAELLYIHPFREGNGRTARLLANLIAYKHFNKFIDFTDILKEKKDQYIKAVQQAASQKYDLMIQLISDGLDLS